MPGACHGTDPIVCRQAALLSPIFQCTLSRGTCVIVHCTAVDSRLSFIILKEGAGKYIFRHADTSLGSLRGSAVHFKEATSCMLPLFRLSPV